MCAHCRHALLTCMIVSSDPLPNAPGPELPFTSKCSNAEPPPWGRPRGAFTSVITSPEPSAGCYALELYVRYACTTGASRAAPRRITAHARSSPSRTQVQRLGPLRGWAALLFFDRQGTTTRTTAGTRSWLDHGHGLRPTARDRSPATIWVAVPHGIRGVRHRTWSPPLESPRAAPTEPPPPLVPLGSRHDHVSSSFPLTYHAYVPQCTRRISARADRTTTQGGEPSFTVRRTSTLTRGSTHNSHLQLRYSTGEPVNCQLVTRVHWWGHSKHLVFYGTTSRFCPDVSALCALRHFPGTTPHRHTPRIRHGGVERTVSTVSIAMGP